MKFNGYSFPHPVLGLGDDYKQPISPPALTIDDSDVDNYCITVHYTLENQELIELLSNGKAVIICEITCTATVFRKVYETTELKQQIFINKDFLRNKTELLFLIAASEKIDDFSNNEFNDDFAKYKFDIERGDVLAYLGETDFVAGISYKKLKAVSSFIEIVKGESETGPYRINLDGPKISIALSAADYEKYCDPRIGRNNRLASVFHSSIALPSLIHAMHRMVKDESAFEDNSWAQVIKHRVENEFPGIAFEEENVPNIAQKLIDLPLNRLMEDLLEKDIHNNEE